MTPRPTCLTESPSQHHFDFPSPSSHTPPSTTTTTTSSSSKRGRGRRSRSSSFNNNENDTRTNGTICRTVYCPTTETTYEGEILLNTNHPEFKTRDSTTIKTTSNSNNITPEKYTETTPTPTQTPTSPSTSTPPNSNNTSIPLFIKHGKGTIHNHRDNTTLVGYFQYNQIIGHALQTFYDDRGKCAIAQYEGSFVPETIQQRREKVIAKQKQRKSSSSKKEKSGSKNGRRRRSDSIASITSTSSKENQNDKDSSSVIDYTNTIITNYQRHGFGKYSWPLTGDEYVGEFFHGNIQGKGTFIWGSTGDRYEGYWYKGRMHGENGRKESSSGDEFIGTFVKGRATGWGKKFYSNGDIHEGMYRKDKRHGYGTYKWENGDQYVGSWQYGRMFGRGIKSIVYTPERSSVYNQLDEDEVQLQRGDLAEVFHGTLVNDIAEGYGVKYYACGDFYHGQYRNGMRDSYGVYTWSNGETYSGQWVNGLMCGIGVKSMANGDVFDGEFFNNEANGFGVKTFGNTGDIHFGEYQNNLRHGKGLYRWSNGDEFEGDYVNGEQNGFGCYRWNEGRMSYEGFWLNGNKHGPGYLQVLVQSGDGAVDQTVEECVFFEVWSKGSRLHREKLPFSMKTKPLLVDLPQLSNWKHAWEGNETTNHDLQRSDIEVGNATLPILENATMSNLEPFADDPEEASDFERHLSVVEDYYRRDHHRDHHRNYPHRHYSVDFYAMAPEQTERYYDEKPRSSSFSSYLQSNGACFQNRRARLTHKKFHNGKSGFVIVSTIRKRKRLFKTFFQNK